MLCSICGLNEVTPSDENEIDFCMSCGGRGLHFDKWLSSDERSNMLTEIRGLDGVNNAVIVHGGESAFRLVVGLRDGEMAEIIAGKKDENDQVTLQGFIPPDDMLWGIGIVYGADRWTQQDQLEFKVVGDVFDDEEVVEALRMHIAGELDNYQEAAVVETETRMIDVSKLVEMMGMDTGEEKVLVGRADDPVIIATSDQYLAESLDLIRGANKGQRRWIVFVEEEDGLKTVAAQGPETQVSDIEFTMAAAASLLSSMRKVSGERDDQEAQEDE